MNNAVSVTTRAKDADYSSYTCPMHPEVEKSAPGMCPECGMALVKTRSANRETEKGERHAGHSTAAFLRKFWVSLILSIPIILYSEFPQTVLGWVPPAFPGSRYLTLALGSVVFFYCGNQGTRV